MIVLRFYDGEQRVFARGFTPLTGAHLHADGPAGDIVWVLKVTKVTGTGDPVEFQRESSVSEA